MTLPPVDPTVLQALDAALESLDLSQIGAYQPVIIPVNPGRKSKMAGSALRFEAPEDREFSGECPGGRYLFVDDVDEAIRLLDYWSWTGCWAAIDLETGVAWRYGEGEEKLWLKGSEPWTSPIYLCSVSVEPGAAVVFDMRELMQHPRFFPIFRGFLTACQLVAHNALFEMSFFLVHFGVMANVVADTLVMHQVATAGKPDRSGLAAVTEKYFGSEASVDKSWQSYFLTIHPRSPIPNAAIRYSAGDVTRLLEIAQRIEAELIETDLWKIWAEIERPFLPEVVRAKVHGLPLDLPLLQALCQEFETRQSVTRERFTQLVGDEVNIASNPQVLKWLNAQGVRLSNVDKEALEPVIETRKGIVGEVAATVLEDRGVSKFLSTYVLAFLVHHRNPITGRVHPDFKQASTVTGRMACEDPSAQNIPKDEDQGRLRKAIVAPPGFELVTADYGQFEVRGLAEMANEVKMIAVFQEGAEASRKLKQFCRARGISADVTALQGSKKAAEQAEYQVLCEQHPGLEALVTHVAECDFHKRTASLLFGVPITQVTKEQRSRSKTVNFAVPYGAGPPGIAEQSGLSIEEATRLLETYYQTYRSTSRFLDLCRQQASRGFTQTPAGRKRFYPKKSRQQIHQELLAMKQSYETLRDQMIEKIVEEIAGGTPMREEEGRTLYSVGKQGWITREEWLAWRLKEHAWVKTLAKWKRPDPAELAEKIWRWRNGKIEREGTNHPIQALNADVTKLASVLIGARLRALDPRCCILLWVHDEIVVSVPAEIADQAAQIVEGSMIEAAKRWLIRTPVEVALTTAPCWQK